MHFIVLKASIRHSFVHLYSMWTLRVRVEGGQASVLKDVSPSLSLSALRDRLAALTAIAPHELRRTLRCFHTLLKVIQFKSCLCYCNFQGAERKGVFSVTCLRLVFSVFINSSFVEGSNVGHLLQYCLHVKYFLLFWVSWIRRRGFSSDKVDVELSFSTRTSTTFPASSCWSS